jgi:carbon monoxide dehydrogenase subunit G
VRGAPAAGQKEIVMEMKGEQLIAAPRSAVWASLNDPDVLRESIPGCEELVKQSDTEFAAVVNAKVGPVSARFKGKVTLSDISPGRSYTISGEGQGGVAGFAKGGAQVSLGDEGEQTRLSYAVTAQVGGKLAQIGSRLIDGVARKMADDFFARFNQAVVRRAGLPGAAPPPAPIPAPSRGLPTWIWVGGLVLLALLLLYLMARPGF